MLRSTRRKRVHRRRQRDTSIHQYAAFRVLRLDLQRRLPIADVRWRGWRGDRRHSTDLGHLPYKGSAPERRRVLVDVLFDTESAWAQYTVSLPMKVGRLYD